MAQDLRLYKSFIGRQIIDCADTIALVAHAHHLSVNVLDPANGISGNIDVDPNRLNVWLDDGSHVKKFTVG
jgi:hypothetical protein